jgi:hypothetical protein
MSSAFEQRCPLCHNNAKCELKDHRNLKHFLCNICVEFLISVGAEKPLLEGIPQWRATLSDKAKLSNREKVFVITLASMALRQEGMASPIFNEEFVERKELAR